ncbi:LPS assembly lipoprotein LptE [Roseomonas xinghualingensis]|uniref:LPS assembly lipoprotein LptE n=1 Tax=Roseomonas xinghualingensis TaxID=2986475 RepID=UPI0021F21AB3|nr:LPS assembly lipoprotein LptE [Roseomonas sp. SXEYE001]
MSQAASSTLSSDMRRKALARRGLLAGLGTMLAGCGFRPLNAPPSADDFSADTGRQLAAVRIGRTYGRSGQLLHQSLVRRLTARDPSALAARYELTVSLLPAFEAQGYRRDGSVSRIRMTMTAPWTLQTIGVPPKPVAAGTSRAFDSYNIVDNEYFASVLSSEEAERRLVDMVAEDIVTRLAITFHENPTA